jgi:hypothetical protein
MMLYFTYLTTYPRQVMTIASPIALDKLSVEPGGTIRLILDYQKHWSIQSSMAVSLVSRGLIIPLPSTVSALPAGRHRIAYLIQVPLFTPPGSYKVYLVKEYVPTLFRESNMLIASNPFDVVPSSPGS